MNDKASVSKLIQGVRDGNASAQQQLYDKYFKTLRIWAQSNQKKLGTRNDVDSPSDIAIKVLKSIMMRAEDGQYPNLADKESLDALLFTIVRRKVLNQKRYEKAAKRPPMVSEAQLKGNSDQTGVSLDSFASREAVDEDGRFILDILDETFLDLDSRLVQIAVLKVHQYTNREIAEELDCSVSLIELSLRKLRKSWAESES